MERETYIEEIKNYFPKTNEDVEKMIEKFKKEHIHKVNIKVEPILNAILTSIKIKDDDKDLLYNDIENNVYIYYYMDKEVFIKLFSYIANPNLLKSLKKLKKTIENDEIPETLRVKSDEALTKNVKELYNIRYQNLLLRYINYLILLFK